MADNLSTHKTRCGVPAHSRRSRSQLMATGLLVAAVGVASVWMPHRTFMAPVPQPRRTQFQMAPLQDHVYQPMRDAPARAHASNDATPWVGLGAPFALILLATVQSHLDRAGRGAFGSPQESQSRAGQTPMRESPQNVDHPVFLDKDLAEKKDKARMSANVAMATGFFLWYAANVSFNIVNKQALGLFPHAWSVSVVQLATVVACSALGWMTGMIPSPRKAMGPDFLWKLLPAALCHALGNGLTSVAFSCGSVSFTHVVKTSEPIWMALGTFLLNGTTLPRPQLLALIPIMLGVALASAGELSFTWVGFIAALASTICFAGRGIFSKRLMSGGNSMSPLNVYAMDSLMALFFTLPVAALTDGQWLASGGMGSLLASGHGPQLFALLASTGLAYYAYNAIAFKLLGKLDVVSHAVGNLGKRIFVIGFSVVAFHTPLTWRAALGSTMAIAGSGLYSYVKATVRR